MPDRILAKMSPKTRIIWSFVIVSLIFFAIVFGFSYVLRQNSQRIEDIQASRIESCQRTYSAFHLVFKPFFPPEESRTKEQQADLDKFDKTIRRLKLGCTKQTNPENAESAGD